MTLPYEIRLRNDTAANWAAANPVLLSGEAAYETDTRALKFGNGVAAWTSLPHFAGSGGLSPNGSRGAPNAITAVGGIATLGAQREVQFITGSGGPITVLASPAIAAGTTIGQELVLIGCSNVNTVTFSSGTGVSLNGTIVMGAGILAGGAGGCLYLVWDGTTWNEVSRR